MLASLLFGYLAVVALLAALMSALFIVLGEHYGKPVPIEAICVAAVSVGAAAIFLQLGARAQRRAFIAESKPRPKFLGTTDHALALKRSSWSTLGVALVLILLGASDLHRYVTTGTFRYSPGRRILSGPDALPSSIAFLVAGVLLICCSAFFAVQSRRHAAAQHGNGADGPGA